MVSHPLHCGPLGLFICVVDFHNWVKCERRARVKSVNLGYEKMMGTLIDVLIGPHDECRVCFQYCFAWVT